MTLTAPPADVSTTRRAVRLRELAATGALLALCSACALSIAASHAAITAAARAVVTLH